MDQPLGRTVGNSLEVAEAIMTLRGDGPPDLTELALVAAAEMLVLGRRAKTKAAARSTAERALREGAGTAKLRELVAAQGGDVAMVDGPVRLPRAPRVETIKAPRTAFVAALDAEQIGIASVRLGAGREKKGDPIDLRTGIVLHAKVGDRVERGQPIADVHVADKPDDAAAIEQIGGAFRWSARRVPRRRLILGRVASR
jgi:thymidine phosphorylase